MKLIITTVILLSLSVVIFFKENQLEDSIAVQVSEKEVIVKKIVKNKFLKKMKFSGYTNASRIVIIKSQVEGKIASKFFKKRSKL